jgi:phenylacetate-coenzyme A ligase PaaK-like adenylate-forming protein
VLFGRIRATYNAGKFDQEMKDKLWGKCAMTVTDVENLLVAKKQNKPAYKRFFAEELVKAECMRQFGEMAVIKTSKKI